MKLFRLYTFSWKQIALFKIYLLSLGLCIGSYWADFFQSIQTILIVIIIILALYFIRLLIKGNI